MLILALPQLSGVSERWVCRTTQGRPGALIQAAPLHGVWPWVPLCPAHVLWVIAAETLHGAQVTMPSLHSPHCSAPVSAGALGL